MNLDYKVLIEFLIKNEKEFRNLINTLNEKYNLDIDTTEMEKAFDALSGISDKEININADGSDAAAEAENVGSEVEDIPDEHSTEITADSGDALADLAHLSQAWNGVLSVIGQVKGVIGDLVETYGVQERADTKLMSSLRENNALIGDNYNLLKDQAAAIQRVTEVGDEETQMLMALALNMGVSFDKVADVSRQSIGLSKAFEAVGLSQQTAMKGLALAYEGDFTQLQRYIPALKTAKDDTEKLALVQEAAAKGFRQATDEAESAAGQLVQLSNEAGDLKEQLGEQLAPAVLMVANGIMDLTKKTMDFLKLTDFAGEEEKTSRMLQYRQQMKDKTLEELEAEQKLIQGRIIGIGSTMSYINAKEKQTKADKEYFEQLSADNQIMQEQQTILNKLIEGKKEAVDAAGESGSKLVELTDDQLAKLKELESKYAMLATADKTQQKLLQLEIEKEAAIAEAEAVEAGQELINQIIQYYSNEKLNIYDEEIKKQSKKREEDYNKKMKEIQKEEDLVNRFRQKQLRLSGRSYDAELQRIDAYYAENTQKLLAAGITETEITEQIEREKLEVKKKYNIDALSLTSSTLGNLAAAAEAFGKDGFAAWKAASMAQAVVDTYAAANAAYKSMASIPVIGPALGAAAAGAAIASGIANVNQIKKTKFKAEKGTVLKGKRHSQGGINVEAEDEEIILTRGVYQHPVYRKIASLINEAAGGDPLADTSVPSVGSTMANGGVINSKGGSIHSLLKQILELLGSIKYPEKIIIEDNRTGRVIWKELLGYKAAYERANK